MTLTLPSLNWLRVFEAAARYQSFARAAAELNMSAAAVSQQIRALEDRLGMPLFDRHAHAVTLTDLGRAYLPSVQQSLISLHDSTEGLFGSGRQEGLFIEAVPLFAHGILAQGCAVFTRKHPEITLTLNSDDGGHDHTSRYHDLHITFGAPAGGQGRVERLLEEQLYPVATPDIAAQISEPADLLNFPLIDVMSHRAGWPYLFEKLGFVTSAARTLHTDNTVLACALAASGAGIVLARAPASDSAVKMAGLVPCLEGFSVDGAHSYHLVSPDNLTLRRPAALFRDWLIDHCNTM